jgi:hypothetical protein
MLLGAHWLDSSRPWRKIKRPKDPGLLSIARLGAKDNPAIVLQ